MEKEQYDEMRRIQNTHWWFVGKQHIVMDMYEAFCKKTCNDTVLDVGCGMGLTLNDLRNKGEVFGMDCEEEAVMYCRSLFPMDYSETHIKYGSLPYDIPFDLKFDSIVALDVIEHVKDDVNAMSELYKKLKPNGRLLLTVPALMSLWSGNDEINHHYRRYEYEELKSKIENAGFHIDKMSFYN